MICTPAGWSLGFETDWWPLTNAVSQGAGFFYRDGGCFFWTLGFAGTIQDNTNCINLIDFCGKGMLEVPDEEAPFTSVVVPEIYQESGVGRDGRGA